MHSILVASPLPASALMLVQLHRIILVGNWNVGEKIIGAAELAVQCVNKDSKLLPGATMEYSWGNSGCSAQEGLAVMGELLKEHEGKISAVIGPGCTQACGVTSYLAGVHPSFCHIGLILSHFVQEGRTSRR